MGWVFLLLEFPVLSGGFIRATVRLSVWLGVAFVFVRFYEKRPFWEHVKLRAHVVRGLVWGVSCSALLLIPSIAYRVYVSNQVFHWPQDVGTWLNPILTAPLAEEILFRGVIFQGLRTGSGFLRSALNSSLLFALVHVPYWILSGSQPGLALPTNLAGVFILGVVFCWLLERSRSLWAPIVYHVLNNLVGQSFV